MRQSAIAHVSACVNGTISVHHLTRLTLQLDVTVYEADLVHPSDCRQQLAEDPPSEALGEVRMPTREEVEQLAAVAVFEYKRRVY